MTDRQPVPEAQSQSRPVASGRRYLLVANQTLGGSQLGAKLAELAAESAQCFVLVPATHPSDYASIGAFAGEGGLGGIHWEDDATGEAQARWRLERTLTRLRELGVPAQGGLGPADPHAAIRALLARESFDEIILSTLPAGVSRWLGIDLPHRVKRSFDIPVTTLIAEE